MDDGQKEEVELNNRIANHDKEEGAADNDQSFNSNVNQGDSAVDSSAGKVGWTDKETEKINIQDDDDDAIKNDPTLYFEDGVRLIDFMLVVQFKRDSDDDKNEEDVNEDEKDVIKEERCSRSSSCDDAAVRSIFETHLIEEGLEIEKDYTENSELCFVKIHAPWDVLTRYAELLHLLKPMKEHDPDSDSEDSPIRGHDSSNIDNFDYEKYLAPSHRIQRDVSGIFSKVGSIFRVDEELCPKRDKRYTCVYSRDKDYLFDIPPIREDFFTIAQRSMIVDYILKRKSFSNDPEDDFAFGISKLIADSVYKAAYPLHEGHHMKKSKSNPRWILYTQWVSLRKSFKQQPLDLVQDYFGVKTGLYFAWLGFYTYMLLPACLVGVACFLYGILTIDNHIPLRDICEENVTMCPQCDHYCGYWQLSQSCSHARFAYLVDNPSTIFFAVFMSIWAVVFLEMWKRYSAKITHRWDLSGFDEFEMSPRPEFLARLARNRRKKDIKTIQMPQEKLSFWTQKFPLTVFSTSMVLLSVALAVAAVIGVILYRMSVQVVISLNGGSSVLVTSNAKIITTATAAALNLICIMIFNQIYYRVASYLTEIEMPRTQLEFDDSLTLKLFCLQFVNYYASIFYIAFFKGRFTGRPGAYNRFMGYRQEECGSGGCLMELTVQLAVIMVGKQAMNAVVEMTLPRLKKFYNTWVLKHSVDPGSSTDSRWLQDYKLAPWTPQGLFYEYLEMVLQFGFVTIFVAAFPLAPFFAILNNILEIRLDAYKFVTTFRRPVAQRVKSIGIWYRILDSIGKFSVLTNACIIAFTTNVIPRIVYQSKMSMDGSLNGFMNGSLSYFDTSNFEWSEKNDTSVKICSYQDYREPPWSPNKYKHTDLYWYILAARLAFIVVFQNAVMIMMTLIRWIIPDVPKKLKDRIRRENFITNQMILEQELLRAKGFIPSHSISGLSRTSNYTPNVSDTAGTNV